MEKEVYILKYKDQEITFVGGPMISTDIEESHTQCNNQKITFGLQKSTKYNKYCCIFFVFLYN